MIRRGTAAFGAVAVLVLLAGLAFAAGGKDARVKAKAFTVSGGLGFQQLKCAGKRRAVGGGALPTGPSGGALAVSGPLDKTGATDGSRNGDAPRQWFVDMHAQSGRTYKAYAICVKSSDARLRTASMPIDDQATKTVTCPVGRRAIGGGVVYTTALDSGVLRLSGSGPLDSTGKVSKTRDGDIARKWRVALDNPTGPHLELKAFAVCSKSSKARIQTASVKIDVNQPGSPHEAAIAVCPAGRRALSGGVLHVGLQTPASIRGSGPLDASLSASGTNTGDKPRYWYSDIAPIGGTTETYKVLAICG